MEFWGGGTSPHLSLHASNSGEGRILVAEIILLPNFTTPLIQTRPYIDIYIRTYAYMKFEKDKHCYMIFTIIFYTVDTWLQVSLPYMVCLVGLFNNKATFLKVLSKELLLQSNFFGEIVVWLVQLLRLLF